MRSPSSCGALLRGKGGGDGCRRYRGRWAAAVADELGRRDERLRVAVHAVLGDVQTRILFVLADPQTVGLLDHVEGREARDEHEREGDAEADHLGDDLLEGAGVDE